MFGLSFGKKKQTTKTTSDLTKNETTNQTQTGTKSNTGTTNTSGTQSTTGSTNTSGTNTQATQQQQQQSTTGSTSLFSDDVLAGLENSVKDLFGSTSGTQDIVDNAVSKLSSFDAAGYVDNSVNSAKQKEQNSLDELLGGISDSIGTNVNNNSMAALLAQRAQGESTARLEGVRADATKTAEEIQRQNQTSAVSAAQSQSGFLGQLLDALKGGTQSTTEVGTGTTTGSSTGTQDQTNTSNQTTNQQQTETQNLIEALTQVLSGTTSTVATEDSTNKTKSGGFGLSLGL